nr:immunoglobulin heavy chain junction region [Mus musculus]
CATGLLYPFAYW